jgi:hypothetical protein
MSDDSDKYMVGFRKPPKGTRFQKGRSGNPRGRPKGAKNFATVLEGELNQRVEITEIGKRRKISMREAITKRLIAKAANGDAKAIQTVLNEIRLYEEAGAATGAVEELEGQADHQVIQSILRRVRSLPSSEAEAISENEDREQVGRYGDAIDN